MAERDPDEEFEDRPDDEFEERPGESFTERLRALAREFGQSIERAAQDLHLDGVADQIQSGGEQVREFAESAGSWLTEQFGEAGEQAGRGLSAAARQLRRAGPHPLDVPTEDQALALSALASGRWKVKPGTEELAFSEDPGSAPDAPAGLVGELRARDWIAASGEVTQLGRDALQRWSQSAE